MLGDGNVAPEGTPWPADALLVRVRKAITYDLRTPGSIRQVYLQIDADQSFDLAVSIDGVSWLQSSNGADPIRSGMLSRTIDLPAPFARYVRLSPHDPSSGLALTEFRVFCTRISDPQRTMTAPSSEVGTDVSAVDPGQSTRIKLVVTVVSLAYLFLLSRRWWREKVTPTSWGKRVESAVWAALGLIAMAAYFNFGAYHNGRYIHDHDVFHYFMGAKYFPEIGYTGLYDCAAVAEAEAGFKERVLARSQRDLRTNRLISGEGVLSRSQECHGLFAPRRWSAFEEDARFFASQGSVESWHRSLRDYGFNASPVWVTFGRAIIHDVPATPSVVGHGTSMWSGLVAALDPLLLLASLGSVLWAFGGSAAGLVAVVFGCNALADFSWIGGAFLRELWFAALTIAICLLRKEKWIAGGAMLGLAATLQLFPVVCIATVALAAAVDWRQSRRWPAEGVRILTGALTVSIVLMALSPFAAGRHRAWSEFGANTKKHAETPSANLVGLPTALSFRSSTRAALLFDEDAVDPFARVRAARVDNLRPLRPVLLIGIGGALYLLTASLKGRRRWFSAAALGLVLVPICLETSSYYAAWLAVLTLADRRCRTSGILLSILAASLAMRLLGEELDVEYAYDSYILVVGMFTILSLRWIDSRVAAR